LLSSKSGPSSIPGSAPKGGFPIEIICDEEIESNLGERRRMNVLYECDGMNVFTRKVASSLCWIGENYGQTIPLTLLTRTFYRVSAVHPL
jgi:hypothetical protein